MHIHAIHVYTQLLSNSGEKHKVYSPNQFLNPSVMSLSSGIIKGGMKDNVQVSSSFTANAHNKLFVFYTEKGDLLKNNYEAYRGGRPHRPPLNPPVIVILVSHILVCYSHELFHFQSV